LGEALPLAQQILEYLGRLKEIKEITVAGSLRRRKETIGDIDILAILKSARRERGAMVVMDSFTTMPGVEKFGERGKLNLVCGWRAVLMWTYGY